MAPRLKYVGPTTPPTRQNVNLERTETNMRGIRRQALTMGFLVTALLPVVAAVSSEAASATPVPVAITQPLGSLASPIAVTPVLPESGQLLLVGTALLGLGAAVRRATKA